MASWNPHTQTFDHDGCKKCGESFSGRKNRQFCSKACKVVFNNERAAERRLSDQRHTTSLVRNIRILEKVVLEQGNGIATVPRYYLNELGFDSKAPMNRVSIKGETWFAVGDYIYMVHKDNTVEILHKDWRNEHDNYRRQFQAG